jgi:5'-nucleotidase / UDP-sugar diphosphatase
VTLSIHRLSNYQIFEGREKMEKSRKQITILHTNDIHGRNSAFRAARGNTTSQTGDSGQVWDEFDREGMVGGFPALATAINRIRQERPPGSVLLVDGGDTFSDDLLGNLTKGEANIRLMNAIGYAFMALGNHDFDYGYERTRELQEIADFPMRAANVIEKDSGQPFLGDPTRIFNINGLRVALVALGYPNTHLTGNKDNYAILEFTDGSAALQKRLPDLRENADVIVVLSHMGTALDRSLAEEVSGIHLIIGGHSHDRIQAENIGGAVIVQAVSDSSVLGETVLTVEDNRVIDIQSRLHTLWVDDYPPDSHVAALLEEIRAPHRETLEEGIGTAEEAIGRNYRSESPFDRLVGEILCQETGADAAFLPGVGYGVTLFPGPITREALYTLLPHPAKVVTLELTGQQILDTLEQSATNQQPEDRRKIVGGIVQTAGIRWTLDYNQPIGSRVRDVTIGAAPVQPDRYYPVVTNAGILRGLHNYTEFARGKNIERHDETLAEVVEKAIKKMGTVRLPKLGELTVIAKETG